MKKVIFGLLVAAVTAAIAVPLAVAGSSPAHATGDVTWDYQGIVTGHVSFNANMKTGGSLDYQNSTGMWLHGVVTSYRQIDDHTAVFAGTITDGSLDYTDCHARFRLLLRQGRRRRHVRQQRRSDRGARERRPHQRQRRLRHVSGERDRHRRQPGHPLTISSHQSWINGGASRPPSPFSHAAANCA